MEQFITYVLALALKKDGTLKFKRKFLLPLLAEFEQKFFTNLMEI